MVSFGSKSKIAQKILISDITKTAHIRFFFESSQIETFYWLQRHTKSSTFLLDNP